MTPQADSGTRTGDLATGAVPFPDQPTSAKEAENVVIESEASQPQATTSTEAQFSVPGMSCDHCVSAITSHVGAVDGVTKCTVDLESKLVSVVGGAADAITIAIEEAGFAIAE